MCWILNPLRARPGNLVSSSRDWNFLREPEAGRLCVTNVLILNPVIYMCFVNVVCAVGEILACHPLEDSLGRCSFIYLFIY